jgi:hypothetical protein
MFFKKTFFLQVNVDTYSQDEVQGVVLEDDKGLAQNDIREPQDECNGEDVERKLSRPEKEPG